MRLIDADAIAYTMMYKESWLKGEGREAPAVWKETIDEMPTIDAEHVWHGKWIKEFENEDGRNLRCSECRMVFYVGKGRDGNYCPNCGARMDEE